MAVAPNTTVNRGNEFASSVYRSDWQLLKAVDTDTTALALRGGLPAAQFTVANVGLGLIEMGPGDALQIEVLGTADGGTVNVLVTAWNPILNSSGAITGWLEDHVATLVFTIGTMAASGNVDGGTLHPDIAETDLWADTVTMSLPATTPSGYILHDPSGVSANTKAFAIIPGDQHKYLQARSERGTAARSGVIARRMQGQAQRS